MTTLITLPQAVLLALTAGLLLLLNPTNALLKYNEIRQKNSHNSYERREGLADMLTYYHMRSLEIDCHLSKIKGQFTVFHDAGMFQSYSSISTLQDGVQILKGFHDMYPNHHVVTIFVDIKNGLNGQSHTAADFDQHIQGLPLFQPSDLLTMPGNNTNNNNTASSLQQAVEENGWPEIEDMRGKFIWVITDGQDSYCMSNEACNSAKSFVGTSVHTAEEIGVKPYVVFYNQNNHYRELAPKINARNYISRVYDHADMNTPEKWKLAKEDGFNIIATDRTNFHRDPFSRTHNQHGFPFESLNGLDTRDMLPDEGGHTMYMYADTGDTWGLADDFHYRYRYENDTTPLGEWMEYTTSVSVQNSHCENFAKAGIMLRFEDARFPLGTGQYFAMIRTCEDLMRVQYREIAYMFTLAERSPAFGLSGVETSKIMGMKVRYNYDGENSTAEGWIRVKYDGDVLDALDGQVDGESWFLIHRQVFPGVHLHVHGVFASSRWFDGNDDRAPFKAIFVDTKQNGKVMTAADFPNVHNGGINDMNDNTVRDEEAQTFGDGYYSPDDTTAIPQDEYEGRRRKMIVDGKERQMRHF